MPEGTKPQEVAEVAQEIGEAAEVKQQLDRATIDPEAAIEKGDIQQSEDLQQVFSDSVQLATAVEKPPEVSPASEGVAPSTPASDPGSSLRPTDSEDLDSPISSASPGNYSAALTQSHKISTTMAAGESEGMSVTANGEEISVSSEAKDNVFAPDVAYVPPTQMPDVQAYDSPPSSSAEDTSQKVVETAQKTPPPESSLDGKTSDPGNHYSGVNLTRGEVEQDNDFNNPPPEEGEKDTVDPMFANPGQGTGVGWPDTVSLPPDSETGFSPDLAVEDPVSASDTDNAAVSEIISVIQGEANEFAATIAAQVESEGSPAQESGSTTDTQNTTEQTDTISEGKENQTDLTGGQIFTVTSIETDHETGQDTIHLRTESDPSSSNAISFTELVDHWREEEANDNEHTAFSEKAPRTIGDDDSQVLQPNTVNDNKQFTLLASVMRAIHVAETAVVRNFLKEDPNQVDTAPESDGNRILQEEVSLFEDELSDWTEGENDEITITKDGTGAGETAATGSYEINPEDQAELLRITLGSKDEDGGQNSGGGVGINGEVGKNEESEETNERSTNSSLDILTAEAETKAEGRAEELTDITANQTEEQEQKKTTSEEQQTLKDELADWPDGETREITVTTWEEGEDGTLVKSGKNCHTDQRTSRGSAGSNGREPRGGRGPRTSLSAGRRQPAGRRTRSGRTGP